MRWGGAGLAVYFVALACCGAFLATQEGQRFVHGPSRAPTAVVEIKYPVFGWPLLAARQNFEHFVNYAFHIPEVCWEGNQVNEFQVRQCQDFWYRFTASSVFVLGPLLLALALLFALRARVHAFYWQAHRKVTARRALYAGTIVDTVPLEVKGRVDFFAYFFGLSPRIVQLQNRELKRVYLSRDSGSVSAGQTLAVFDGGRVFGKERPVAIPFSPQVVTVR